MGMNKNRIFIYISILLIFEAQTAQLFDTNPYLVFKNSTFQQWNGNIINLKPEVIKISPDETKYIVGYQNGFLAIFDIKNGIKLRQMTKSSLIYQSKVLKILWQANSKIYILTDLGQIWTWTQQLIKGQQYFTKSQISDFTICQNDQNKYMLTYSTKQFIRQYQANNFSSFWTYNYTQYADLITTIQCSHDQAYIYGRDERGDILVFDTLNTVITDKRVVIEQFYAIDQTDVKHMQILHDKSIGVLTSKNTLYKINGLKKYPFESIFINQFRAKIVTKRKVQQFIACKGRNQMILSLQLSNQLKIIDVAQGNTRQTLKHLSNQVKSMDCSRNYFAAIDIKGRITLNTIQTNKQIDQDDKQNQIQVNPKNQDKKSIQSQTLITILIFLATIIILTLIFFAGKYLISRKLIQQQKPVMLRQMLNSDVIMAGSIYQDPKNKPNIDKNDKIEQKPVKLIIKNRLKQSYEQQKSVQKIAFQLVKSQDNKIPTSLNKKQPQAEQQKIQKKPSTNDLQQDIQINDETLAAVQRKKLLNV